MTDKENLLIQSIDNVLDLGRDLILSLTKDKINKLHPFLRAYTPKEMRDLCPDQEEDWEDGSYIVVTDNIEKGVSLIDGAYCVSIEDNHIHAVWLPYPSEPIDDIDTFLEIIRKDIDDYENNK